MTTTLSVDVQPPFVMVHCKVYALPTFDGFPVNVEVELFAVPKLPPVPVTTLQAPVPTEGALAASVVEGPQIL